MTKQRKSIPKLTANLFLCLAFLFTMLPLAAYATEKPEETTVKVGYVLFPGYQEGGEGEYKTGQGYEYLQRIASYTGWSYEYVYGSFGELIGQLMRGEIDLMGDISYTDERAKTLLFGTYEQGKESYYLYVCGDQSGINPEDLGTLNGKKIGICGASYQNELWYAWCEENQVQCEIVEFASSEDRELALNDGTIDGAIEPFLLGRNTNTALWRSVLKFGDAPYYFAVTKQRPELLHALNTAQSHILNENPYYNEELSTRYVKSGMLSTSILSKEEMEWLETHDNRVRIGFMDNIDPLSDVDANGTAHGIILDYIAFTMQDMGADYGLQIDSVPYGSYRQMIDDLKAGVIDVATPVYGDYWNADQEGVSLTNSLLSTTMLMLYKGTYSAESFDTLGINQSSPFQSLYASIHFPGCRQVFYNSNDEAINALKQDEVDAVLNTSCTYEVAKLTDEMFDDIHGFTLPNSVGISMAVARRNSELMSFLNREISLMGSTRIFNSMAANSNIEPEYTAKEFLRQNQLLVTITLLIVFCVLFFLILRLKHSVYKARTDSMTGLLNKTAMEEAIRSHLRQGGVMMMLDIDNFKGINDSLGHNAGDLAIRQLSETLKQVFRSADLIGRFGGDEFMVFLPEAAMSDETIKEKSRAIQKGFGNCSIRADHEEVNCTVSLGVLKIHPGGNRNYAELFEMVDAALYKSKANGKDTITIQDC